MMGACRFWTVSWSTPNPIGKVVTRYSREWERLFFGIILFVVDVLPNDRDSGTFCSRMLETQAVAWP